MKLSRCIFHQYQTEEDYGTRGYKHSLLAIRRNLKKLSHTWKTTPVNRTETLVMCNRTLYSILLELDFSFLLKVQHKSLEPDDLQNYCAPKFVSFPRLTLHVHSCFQIACYSLKYYNKFHHVVFEKTADFDCKLKALNEQPENVRCKPEGYFTYAGVRQRDFSTKRKLIDVGDKYWLTVACLWSWWSCQRVI